MRFEKDIELYSVVREHSTISEDGNSATVFLTVRPDPPEEWFETFEDVAASQGVPALGSEHGLIVVHGSLEQIKHALTRAADVVAATNETFREEYVNRITRQIELDYIITNINDRVPGLIIAD